ncbi:MAG TPA: transglutaminase family protein [Candidatus Binataceae bacterium]|nr:transglutaminase family protein [Candidatus Binataceae bacterium]
MALRVNHTTTYTYSEPVSICHTEVCLKPRTSAAQTLLEHELVIVPAPEVSIARQDYFGNTVTYFSSQEPHLKLTITAHSVVEVHTSDPLQPRLTPKWEQVSEEVRHYDRAETFDALQFVFESPRVRTAREFADYARPSFPAGRPLLEGALDLCGRIYKEFKYDQRATTVSTPVDEVLRIRHGVCQDFAHLMIACLRSIGLPARYVSGYLRSGRNSVGSEASHAWASVFCSGFGWLDLDPTNNLMPAANHVTAAWGRDYSDVSPVKGVALGGGEQAIKVGVDVAPVPVQY